MADEDLQLAPYLAAYLEDDAVRVGQLPPLSTVIERPPPYLPELLRHVAAPQPRTEIERWLVDRGVASDEARDLIDELAGAGLLARPIDPDTRYARHLLYYDLLGLEADEAQQRLRESRVGLIGVGGIGSNVAVQLAAAGVGELVISDGDVVELSNLTRQTLYNETHLGRRKVEVASERLRALNSELRVRTVPRGFDGPELVTRHFADCDFIVLSADVPVDVTRWLSCAAIPLGIPHSSAGYVEGYASIGPMVVPGHTGCLECARVGMSRRPLLGVRKPASYGPMNYFVAAVQANEVIRHLLGLDTTTFARRVMYDFASYQPLASKLDRHPACPICGDPNTTTTERKHGTLAAIAQTYDKERTHASFNSLLLDPLLAEIIPPACAGARALDIGCGSGEVTRMLADKGYEVVGSDPEPAMLAIARERNAGPHITYQQASLSELAEHASFDLVTCLNVLDWIEDFEDALARVRDSLRVGGKLILSVPHPFKDSGGWRKNWNGERWVFEDFAVTSLYFAEGPIEKTRDDSAGNTVIAKTLTFKRTVETYVRALIAAGFALDMLHEPQPLVAEAPIVLVEKASRVPYFLVLCATRRSDS